MSPPSAPTLGIIIVSLLGLLHQDAAAQPYPDSAAGETVTEPSSSDEFNGVEEPAVLEPPPELEGFERAKWFYRMVAGPLVDPEREERLHRAEEEFWRRVEEILAGDYAVARTEEQPEDAELAHDAVPVARLAEEQDDVPAAAENPEPQQPRPQRQPAPLPTDDRLPRAVADAAELERKLDEHAATLQELRKELEGLKRQLAELIRGRLEVDGGQ